MKTLKTINVVHDFEIPAGMPFNRSSAFVELLRGLVVSYLEKPQLGLKHTSSP